MMHRDRTNCRKSFKLVSFPHRNSCSSVFYLQGAAITLLSLLQEAVAADRWSLQAQVGGFVHQAARLARCEVLLIIAAAAAAEGARDVPAGKTGRETRI